MYWPIGTPYFPDTTEGLLDAIRYADRAHDERVQAVACVMVDAGDTHELRQLTNASGRNMCTMLDYLLDSAERHGVPKALLLAAILGI